MVTTRIFTDPERTQFLSLYRLLRDQAPSAFAGRGYRTLRTAISGHFSDGHYRRDVFGIHPIIRSIQTALLITEEIGVNEDAIRACLLTPYIESVDELEELTQTFGASTCRILHGLIQLRELYKKNPSVESENFRNLLVSFAEDMRVILIMIADRTNLMRQIKDTDRFSAREQVARESAYLYAPLAHKLGLYTLKSELEDLSLKYLNHDAYYHIKDKLNATKRARDGYIDRFIAPISERLTKEGFSFHIKGRTKSIHSIWQKMQKQECEFEGVYDLFAIRIILDAPREKEKLQCWQVYSLVTDMYTPNPKRLRDWLSIPKSNGYESLHITVRGPESKWVEVQIRSERMDDVAEHGLAAHWRYKGVKTEDRGIEDWLANIRSALENNDDEQLMDQFKSDIKADEIFVFTPKGDLYKLAKGATVLDFAYSIHTNIGNHCTGAIINEKNASMRQELQSGDQVSILTSASQLPKRAWTDYVVTGRAKAKIRQSIKEMEVKESGLGKELLERKFRNRKMDLDMNTLNPVIKRLGYKEISLFYKDIADQLLDTNVVIDAYQQQYLRETGQAERAVVRSAEEFSIEDEKNHPEVHDDVLIIDRNLRGLDFSLARCCNPIYGDEIFGFVTINSGIKVHRVNCPNAAALRARYPYRVVKARWAGRGVGDTYPIVLRIVGIDDLGVVNNISSIISKEERINMRSFSIDSHDGLFSGMLTVMVSDTATLDALVKKLKTVKGVKHVTRS